MITIRNWIPTIPEEDKHIAYVGEGQSVEKEFFVTGEGWEKFRDWTYHLDMAFDLSGVTARDSREVVMVKEDGTVSEPDPQNKITSKTTTTETYTVETVDPAPYPETDIAYLHKEVEADGLRLHWNILRQHTQLAGKLTANLRAVGPDEEIKKSALMVFEVDPTVSAVPAVPPTENEFEQMEQRMGQMCEEMRALQMDIADNANAVNTQALEVQQSAVQAQQSAVQAEQYAIAAADYTDDAADLAQDAADSVVLAQTAVANANESLQQAKKQASSASSSANVAKQAVSDAQKYSNQVAGYVNTAKEHASAAQSSANSASSAAQNAASSAETAYNDMVTSRQNVVTMQGQLAAAQKAAEDAEASARWAQSCANSAEGSVENADAAASALMDAASRIPPEYAENDRYFILRVNGNGDGLEFVNIAQDMYLQTWVIPYLLPTIGTGQEGMVLKVVNGKWTAVNP